MSVNVSARINWKTHRTSTWMTYQISEFYAKSSRTNLADPPTRMPAAIQTTTIARQCLLSCGSETEGRLAKSSPRPGRKSSQRRLVIHKMAVGRERTISGEACSNEPPSCVSNFASGDLDIEMSPKAWQQVPGFADKTKAHIQAGIHTSVLTDLLPDQGDCILRAGFWQDRRHLAFGSLPGAEGATTGEASNLASEFIAYAGIGLKGAKVVTAYSGKTRRGAQRGLEHLTCIEQWRIAGPDTAPLHYSRMVDCDEVMYFPLVILSPAYEHVNEALAVWEWVLCWTFYSPCNAVFDCILPTIPDHCCYTCVSRYVYHPPSNRRYLAGMHLCDNSPAPLLYHLPSSWSCFADASYS